jgi:acyl-CoA reductase-like NAD-dependent aldehyde dehydrogenase
MTATSTLTVVNPYTGEVVGEGPVASTDEVVGALDNGAEYGSPLSRHERSQLLFSVADRLGALRDELAHLISSESGLSPESPSTGPTTPWRSRRAMAGAARGPTDCLAR